MYMNDKVTVKQFKERMQTIKIVDGWTGGFEDYEFYGKPMWKVFVLKNDALEIELRFDQHGAGHTNFIADGTSMTFDRLGIEDSFYWLPWGERDDGDYDLNHIVAAQLDRIAEFLAVSDTLIPVPGLPYSVAPDKLERMKNTLAEGGSVTLSPAGMGTAHRLTTRRTRDAKYASKALRDFFVCDELFVSTIDWD